MVEDDLEATFMIRLLHCLFLRIVVSEQKSSKVTALGSKEKIISVKCHIIYLFIF